MVDGENRRAARVLDGLLAGLEAGVLAALALLGWLALASAWYRRSIWTSANIMATTFYGDAALGGMFTSRTLAGLSLYLALYGIAGALFGLALAGRGPRLPIALCGILAGLAWYFLAFDLLWRNLNPLIALYTHRGPMLAGHLLYGAMLGRFPRYLEPPRHAA